MKHRRQLLARYHDELARADEELDEPEIEVIERATEQWDAEVLSRLGEADARALDEISAAIQRMDDGTYGECVTCGNEIAGARLAALPTALECIECANLAAIPVMPPSRLAR